MSWVAKIPTARLRGTSFKVFSSKNMVFLQMSSSKTNSLYIR